MAADSLSRVLARPSSRLCGPISFSQQMLHCEDGSQAPRTHLHWDEQDGEIVTNSGAASLNSPSPQYGTAFAGAELQAEYLKYFDIAVIIISGGGPNVTSQ